jgi:hypothetical protein
VNPSVCERPSTFHQAVGLLSDAANPSKPTDAISSATAAIYVEFLWRVANISAQFDQATNPTLLRSARFAIRDQQNLIAVADRCLRGVYDSLAVRPRLWLEQSGIKYQEPAEEGHR